MNEIIQPQSTITLIKRVNSKPWRVSQRKRVVRRVQINLPFVLRNSVSM